VCLIYLPKLLKNYVKIAQIGGIFLKQELTIKRKCTNRKAKLLTKLLTTVIITIIFRVKLR